MKILAGVVLVIAATTLSAQTPAAQFDAASIKPTPADASPRAGVFYPPGRLQVENYPVGGLVRQIYGSTVDAVEGLPKWAGDRYNITATYPDGTSRDQVREMLRTLLVQRFAFAAHVESRERDGLALVRIQPEQRLPPGIQRVDVDCSDPQYQYNSGTPVAPLLPREPNGEMPPCLTISPRNLLNSGGMNMKSLAERVSLYAGRQVFDATGLDGDYRFQLRFNSNPGPATRDVADDGSPDIATALREQLGLKLIPYKATMTIAVVDRFERPSPD